MCYHKCILYLDVAISRCKTKKTTRFVFAGQFFVNFLAECDRGGGGGGGRRSKKAHVRLVDVRGKNVARKVCSSSK